MIKSLYTLFLTLFAITPSFANTIQQNAGHIQLGKEFSEFTKKSVAFGFSNTETKNFCSNDALSSKDDIEDLYFEVKKHQNLPVYYLHFQDEKLQDLMFERMVTFSDEGGKKLDLKKIKNPEYEGTDGMNIAGQEIASFYNLMKESNQKLNAAEEHLIESLIKKGDLALENGRLKTTKNFAVISSAKQSAPSTAFHELRHAIYVTDPSYRKKVINLYDGLNNSEKQMVKSILDDVGDHKPENGMEVFYTEFGAYFRDPKTLYSEYSEVRDFSAKEKKFIDKVSKQLEAIESSLPSFNECEKTQTAENNSKTKNLSSGQK